MRVGGERADDAKTGDLIMDGLRAKNCSLLLYQSMTLPNTDFPLL